MAKIRITEYLDIDLEREMWTCHRCRRELIGARENYKKGCLVYERDPDEIFPPIFPPDEAEFHMGVADGYGVFIEFYCPGCGTMFENELLPEGYPPTYDLQLDIDQIKDRVEQGEYTGPMADEKEPA